MKTNWMNQGQSELKKKLQEGLRIDTAKNVILFVGKHAWQGRGHAWRWVCVAGACMAGGVHGMRACVAGGMHGGGGHAWQGLCMTGGVHGRGVCVAGGHAWWGACVAGVVCGGACVVEACMAGEHA